MGQRDMGQRDMGERDMGEHDMGELVAFSPSRRGGRVARPAGRGAVLFFTGVRRERLDQPARAGAHAARQDEPAADPRGADDVAPN
ncbi:hypothetical protein [Methylocella sp.]|uniref:hypothetical protein n=1 Tax=Methylocella sp. TaxID=1978226 RepID=UPI003785189D